MIPPCSTLDNSIDDAGDVPQHQVMTDGYDYDAPNSVHQLSFDSIPDFKPDFDTVIISGRARLTDLISSSPIVNCGLLVSSRFRSLLEVFQLPKHRFYDVPIVHRGKNITGYSWLQLPQPAVQIPENATRAAVEQIISDDTHTNSCDLLRFYRPHRFAYCFVSAPLRTAIENEKMTGVRFGTARIFGARRHSAAQ